MRGLQQRRAGIAIGRFLRLLSVAVVLASVAAVSAAEAAAPERMGFGSYGQVKVGDTPSEVRRLLPLVEPCRRLGGRCVCDALEVGNRSVNIVYALDRRPGVDLITTSANSVVGPRGLSVGDSIRRLKRLFPSARRRPSIHLGFPRWIVNRGRIGLLVAARAGRIYSLVTGKNRFFHYEEYCS